MKSLFVVPNCFSGLSKGFYTKGKKSLINLEKWEESACRCAFWVCVTPSLCCRCRAQLRASWCSFRIVPSSVSVKVSCWASAYALTSGFTTVSSSAPPVQTSVMTAPYPTISHPSTPPGATQLVSQWTSWFKCFSSCPMVKLSAF